MRISISYKLIFITVALLLATAVPIALQSYSFYAGESTRREEITKEGETKLRATELERIFSGIKDKSKIIATLLLKQSIDPDNRVAQETLNLAFEGDQDLVAVSVIKKGGRTLGEIVDKKTLEKFKKKKDYIQSLNGSRALNLDLAFTGQLIVRNATVKNGVPLIAMAYPFTQTAAGQVESIVVTHINWSTIQKRFSEISASSVYLIDDSGMVLAHPEQDLALARQSFAERSLVQAALISSQKRFQTKYFNEQKNGAYIAAFTKTEFGPIVISEVPEDLILEPARMVRRQSFFTAGLILSTALFLVFMFSISLTTPIENLVALTKEISQGNFDVTAQETVKSKDEVGELASAFDEMTSGLKERDKVKNLFSKFHGSSVADDLMSNESLEVGGQNKSVTVFFSDIRGFTKFSESRSPEEVVDMLNEYFEIMVAIITRNHGIVDKFIGDAIMAVWGAPQSTGKDPEFAIKACLEMRQALEELNKKRIKRNQDPIMIGMGLHSGQAISGTIGSEERMEFTVIGDTVNMTARIEASTKAFGTDLLVSEDTANSLGDKFIMERAGAAEVKGKSKPLELYKVRGVIHEDGSQETIQTEYSDYEPEAADKVKVS